MPTLEFWSYVAIACAALLSLVLLALLTRVRLGLGRQVRGLAAILTDGMIVFTLQVLAVGCVLLARVAGGLAGPEGALVGRFGILLAILVSTAIGVGRLLYWFLYDDGITSGELDERLSIDDEVQRLSLRLGRYLDLRADEQRQRARRGD